MSDQTGPDESTSEHESTDLQEDSVGDGNQGATNGDNDNVEITTLVDFFAKLRADLLGAKEQPEQVLAELSLKGIADYIQSEKCNKIIVMTGAGISTAAGIPDFRSPDTGLYSQLEKYNLPHPQSIFELGYFKENPEPFFLLAREMWPGNYKPTISHFFLCLLEKKNLLLRSFTQNIDGLELVAGLPKERLIPAHGTFHTSHCIKCYKEYPIEWMKELIFEKKIPECSDMECGGLVKPDIVFFGESLPKEFFVHMQSDFPSADLLIVMGTSLLVQPFCMLIDKVEETIPRLLINREKCGEGRYGYGFDFDGENRYRDVAFLGDCDEGCLQLAELLGWKEELLDLVKNGCELGAEKSVPDVGLSEVFGNTTKSRTLGGNASKSSPTGGNASKSSPTGGNASKSSPTGGNASKSSPTGGNASKSSPKGGNVTKSSPKGGNATKSSPKGGNATKSVPKGGSPTKSKGGTGPKSSPKKGSSV